MIERCRQCGGFITEDHCPDCRRKEIRSVQTGCPCVLLPDGLMVTEVRLSSTPVNPAQPTMTLDDAEKAGFVLRVREGRDDAVYIKSSRVRLIIRRENG